MTAIKEQIIEAVTFMSNSDAEKFWKVIQKQFQKQFPSSWDEIEEVAPDEVDLMMLKKIEEDPECHKFTKESEINWDE